MKMVIFSDDLYINVPIQGNLGEASKELLDVLEESAYTLSDDTEITKNDHLLFRPVSWEEARRHIPGGGFGSLKEPALREIVQAKEAFFQAYILRDGRVHDTTFYVGCFEGKDNVVILNRQSA